MRIRDLFRRRRKEEQSWLSDSIPKISEHAIWRKIASRELFVVVLSLASGIFHILEGAEARVWLLADEEKTIGQIVDKVHEEFPRIRSRKVMEIIDNFEEKGLVDLTQPEPANAA